MKDKLIDQLQERFADHGMDVGAEVWEGISQQLAVANGTALRETLQQKFTGHEVHVDPSAWANISQQLGQGVGAAAGTGATAWWVAGIAASVLAVGTLVYTAFNNDARVEKPQVAATVPQAQVEQRASGTTTTPVERTETAPAPVANRTHAATPIAPQPAPPSVPALQRPSSGSTPTTTGQAGSQVPSAQPASNEGQAVVTGVLQDIVDHYVTEPQVIVTEKVPPPTQQEMPSEEVHPNTSMAAAPVVPEDAPDEEHLTPALVEAPAPEVFIPTAFSPNGDNVNDEFQVTGDHYQKVLVRIFSAASNALVFASDNLAARWNGRLMNTGTPCEPGMYFYAMEVVGEDGRTYSKGEVIRLFR